MNPKLVPLGFYAPVLKTSVSLEDRAMLMGPQEYSPDPDVFAGNIYAILGNNDVLMGSFSWDFCFDGTYIGFYLLPEFRGRGILPKVWEKYHRNHGVIFRASCWDHNIASHKVLRSLGFRHKGVEQFSEGLVANYLFIA